MSSPHFVNEITNSLLESRSDEVDNVGTSPVGSHPVQPLKQSLNSELQSLEGRLRNDEPAGAHSNGLEPAHSGSMEPQLNTAIPPSHGSADELQPELSNSTAIVGPTEPRAGVTDAPTSKVEKQEEDDSSSSDDEDAPLLPILQPKRPKRQRTLTSKAKEVELSASSEDEDEEDENQDTYCVCREVDDGRPMIMCEQCHEWYHFDCVHLTKKEAAKIESYLCERCINGLPPYRELDQQASKKTKLKAKQRERATTTKRKPSQTKAEKPSSASALLKISLSRPRSLKPPTPSPLPGTPTTPVLGSPRLDSVDAQNAVRKTVVNGFRSVLGEDLANSIEQALFKEHGESVTKDYKRQYRLLIQNLKDRSNPALVQRVQAGKIAPDAFVTMSAQELASQELVRQREKAAQEKIKDIVKPLDEKTDIRGHKRAVAAPAPMTVSDMNKSAADTILTGMNSPKMTGSEEARGAVDMRSASAKNEEEEEEKNASKVIEALPMVMSFNDIHGDDGVASDSDATRTPTGRSTPDSFSASSDSEAPTPAPKKLTSPRKRPAPPKQSPTPVKRQKQRSAPKKQAGMVSPSTQDYLPCVFEGSVKGGEGVGVFPLTLRQVGGRRVNRLPVPETLRIAGRLKLSAVESYLKAVTKRPSREVLVLEVAENLHHSNYKAFESTFQAVEKAAVVDFEKTGGPLLYIIPSHSVAMSSRFCTQHLRLDRPQTCWVVLICSKAAYETAASGEPYQRTAPVPAPAPVPVDPRGRELTSNTDSNTNANTTDTPVSSSVPAPPAPAAADTEPSNISDTLNYLQSLGLLGKEGSNAEAGTSDPLGDLLNKVGGVDAAPPRETNDQSSSVRSRWGRPVDTRTSPAAAPPAQPLPPPPGAGYPPYTHAPPPSHTPPARPGAGPVPCRMYFTPGAVCRSGPNCPLSHDPDVHFAHERRHGAHVIDGGRRSRKRSRSPDPGQHHWPHPGPPAPPRPHYGQPHPHAHPSRAPVPPAPPHVRHGDYSTYHPGGHPPPPQGYPAPRGPYSTHDRHPPPPPRAPTRRDGYTTFEPRRRSPPRHGSSRDRDRDRERGRGGRGRGRGRWNRRR